MKLGPMSNSRVPAVMERMERAERAAEFARPAREAELAASLDRAEIDARWSHKNDGTPQTHERAARTVEGPLARLYMQGILNSDQLQWAVEIGETAEALERDVAVRVVSYEPRIDCQASGKDALVEGILRARREVAYSWWRQRVQHPARAVLDMLVGEPVAFSTVARRYGMGKGRARRMLLHAIDLWPDAMERAEEQVDPASLAAAHAGLI